jgi:tRNA G46 methylase TrmB
MSITNPLPRSAFAGKLKEFPDLAFADADAFRFRGRWADFFRQRIGPAFNGRIILEIGCFDARFLSRIAQKNPNIAFIGIDWKCKAIYDGASHIAQTAIHNVALLRARAQDLPKLVAEGELNEIWVFHPDPCDREHERKHRLIGKQFLVHVFAALKDHTSLLALKTDHLDYYQSTLDLFTVNSTGNAIPDHDSIRALFDLTLKSEHFWNDPIALSHAARRCFATERTLFEDRFVKKRKPIFLLEITKRPSRS